MSGYPYRVPSYPAAPGIRPPEEDMAIATSWIVKSLITRPRASLEVGAGDAVQVGGHAWAGENRVERVLVSTDFGITWQETALTDPANRYYLRCFRASNRPVSFAMRNRPFTAISLYIPPYRPDVSYL